MKIFARIFFCVCLLSPLASRAATAEGNLTFTRPGDTGLLNIFPVTVILEGQKAFTIIGERSVTIRLPVGKYKVKIQSSDPYSPSDQSIAWKTGPVEVVLSKEGSEYIIEGAETNSGYDHWEIRKKTEPNQSPEPTYMLVTPTVSHPSRYASVHL
ncbi:MAG TPA: hypothetical protein VL357_01425 [Rariglobus sp.]|jgi:hypothetical protein|nr:hypothetical protein [Rariglobus sp.]